MLNWKRLEKLTEDAECSISVTLITVERHTHAQGEMEINMDKEDKRPSETMGTRDFVAERGQKCIG